MLTSWSCLRQGINVLAQDLPLLLGAWLVILGVQQLIDLLIPASWIGVGLLAQIVVLAPLYAGQYLLTLRVVRNQPAKFQDLFRGFPFWGTLAAVSLLSSLATGIGFILLIVPGIVWALMFSFAPIVVLDRGDTSEKTARIGAVEAMKCSKDLTEGYRGTLFGISLLLVLPSLVVIVLLSLSASTPEFAIPTWAIELFALLSGTLFLGPLHAASYMVAYDAITGLVRPSELAEADSAV